MMKLTIYKKPFLSHVGYVLEADLFFVSYRRGTINCFSLQGMGQVFKRIQNQS